MPYRLFTLNAAAAQILPSVQTSATGGLRFIREPDKQKFRRTFAGKPYITAPLAKPTQSLKKQDDA